MGGYDRQMITGTNFCGYLVGQKIGQGSFGEIYAVRSTESKKLFALKLEPMTSRRKILEFETVVMKSLTPHPCFPFYVKSGESHGYTWLTMELLGPSLYSALRRMPDRQLTKSTGLRVLLLILDGVENMHSKGFIHRDLKPSNILLRRSREHPIALIDFGLSRTYIDRKTGAHLPPRDHPGFRGTAMYASPNAHAHKDLSRRDDLVSWYYIAIDICGGGIPWKRVESKVEMHHMKRKLDIPALGEKIAPQFREIWQIIDALEYESAPDYDKIRSLLQEAVKENGINQNDEWDWHPHVLSMDGADTFEFGKYAGAAPLSKEEHIQLDMCEAQKRSNSGLNPTPLLKGSKPDDPREMHYVACCGDCGCYVE